MLKGPRAGVKPTWTYIKAENVGKVIARRNVRVPLSKVATRERGPMGSSRGIAANGSSDS